MKKTNAQRKNSKPRHLNIIRDWIQLVVMKLTYSWESASRTIPVFRRGITNANIVWPTLNVRVVVEILVHLHNVENILIEYIRATNTNADVWLPNQNRRLFTLARLQVLFLLVCN